MRPTRLELVRSPTRPSNVRVCQFRHGRHCPAHRRPRYYVKMDRDCQTNSTHDVQLSPERSSFIIGKDVFRCSYFYTIKILTTTWHNDDNDASEVEIMIEIRNVSKSYDGRTNAVSDLSLDIWDGEIFGFLGPNGAGKTTTLKLITGLLSLDSGSIKINGHDIERDPIRTKREFAFVPDNADVFPRLKGIEYLRFIADIYDVDEPTRLQRIEELTTRFGIRDVLNDMIKSYSHGMRQKLILTGALLHNPNAWILDEPMTGLDPASSFQLKQLMREHADDGKIVLFSTHVLDVAEKVCDRLIVMDEGQLVFVGTIDELKARYQEDASLESMFLKLVGKGDDHVFE